MLRGSPSVERRKARIRANRAHRYQRTMTRKMHSWWWRNLPYLAGVAIILYVIAIQRVWALLGF